MTDTTQVAQLQNVVDELRQDLGAHQKELSSKTKKLVQMENMVSSLSEQLTQRNKEFDELQITHKMASEHRTDEMYLQLEEYKNQIHSKEMEKQEIRQSYAGLQRQYSTLKQQNDALLFKHQQTDNEYKVRLNRLDSMYKQRIETLQHMNQSQMKQSQDQMAAIKQTQFLSSNQEAEHIKKELLELKESHERIEADLNSEIEDLKDQMTKREKEKDQLIQELNQLSANYKQYAQNEIEKLTEKLKRYEAGDVEIVLQIEVNDPILSKPPPKKPAPPKPMHSVSQSLHSHHSSKADSNHSIDALMNGDSSPRVHTLSLLTPSSPNKATKKTLTLRDVKSNPDLWNTNDRPTAMRNIPHRSMALRDLSDDDDDEDARDIEDGDNGHSDDSKESKSDDENRLFPHPVSIMTQAKSAGFDENAAEYKVSVNGGTGRKIKNRRRAQSKSATSIPGLQSSSSGNRTPIYIFRPSKQQSNNEESDDIQDTNDLKSYNAMLAKHYLKRRESLSKYTDSALNVLKNGVFQMWGSNTKPPKGAQTPNPVSRNRYITGGFPNTRSRQQHPRTHSNVSSISSFGDLFSDNISLASFGSAYGAPKNGTSSVRLSASDALSSKSLELQRKMLMQSNTRLAEDLKNEKKHLMIIKEKAQRKYKQLHITLQAEQRQWKLKESQMGTIIERHNQQKKEYESEISEIQKKYHALQRDYNVRLNSGDPNAFQQQNTNTNNQQYMMQKVHSLETNNKQLIAQCEKYRRETSSLKQTVLTCNDTMKQQQKQILILNTNVSELRKLNGFGGGSSEQLLQKQIRLLKSQRRMLVKELRDIRNQNDKLKKIIVSGSTKTYSKK